MSVLEFGGDASGLVRAVAEAKEALNSLKASLGSVGEVNAPTFNVEGLTAPLAKVGTQFEAQVQKIFQQVERLGQAGGAGSVKALPGGGKGSITDALNNLLLNAQTKLQEVSRSIESATGVGTSNYATQYRTAFLNIQRAVNQRLVASVQQLNDLQSSLALGALDIGSVRNVGQNIDDTLRGGRSVGASITPEQTSQAGASEAAREVQSRVQRGVQNIGISVEKALDLAAARVDGALALSKTAFYLPQFAGGQARGPDGRFAKGGQSPFFSITSDEDGNQSLERVTDSIERAALSRQLTNRSVADYTLTQRDLDAKQKASQTAGVTQTKAENLDRKQDADLAAKALADRLGTSLRANAGVGDGAFKRIGDSSTLFQETSTKQYVQALAGATRATYITEQESLRLANAERANEIAQRKAAAAAAAAASTGGGSGGGGNRGIVGGFLGGAFGHGFDAHAVFSPAESIANLAGTVGVLARYAAGGKAIQALSTTITTLVKDYLDTQVALAELQVQQQAVNSGNIDLTASFAATAEAGLSEADAIRLGTEALAAYGHEIRAGGDAHKIFTESVQAAGEAAVITGQKAAVAQQQLIASTNGFGIGAGGQQRVLSASVNAEHSFGGTSADILAALATIPDLLSAAGFGPEEGANLIALVQRNTQTNASTAASNLQRVIGNSGSATFQTALAGLGVKGTGDLQTDLAAASQKYNTLDKKGQEHALSGLGNPRDAGALAAVLKDFAELTDANTRSFTGGGAAFQAYQRQLQSVGGQVKEFGGDLKRLGLDVVKSGLLDFLGALVKALDGVVRDADRLAGVFDSLPFHHLALDILEVVAALRLLRNTALVSGLATGVGGLLTKVGEVGALGRAGGALAGAGRFISPAARAEAAATATKAAGGARFIAGADGIVTDTAAPVITSLATKLTLIGIPLALATDQLFQFAGRLQDANSHRADAIAGLGKAGTVAALRQSASDFSDAAAREKHAAGGIIGSVTTALGLNDEGSHATQDTATARALTDQANALEKYQRGLAASNYAAAQFGYDAQGVADGLKRMSEQGRSATSQVDALTAALAAGAKASQTGQGVLLPGQDKIFNVGLAASAVGSVTGDVDHALTELDKHQDHYETDISGKGAKDQRNKLRSAIGKIPDLNERVTNALNAEATTLGLDQGGVITPAKRAALIATATNTLKTSLGKAFTSLSPDIQKVYTDAWNKGFGAQIDSLNSRENRRAFVTAALQNINSLSSNAGSEATTESGGNTLVGAKTALDKARNLYNVGLTTKDIKPEDLEAAKIAVDQKALEYATAQEKNAAALTAITVSQISSHDQVGRLRASLAGLTTQWKNASFDERLGLIAQIADVVNQIADQVVASTNAARDALVAPNDAVGAAVAAHQDAVDELNNLKSQGLKAGDHGPFDAQQGKVNSTAQGIVTAQVDAVNAQAAAALDPRNTIGKDQEALAATNRLLASQKKIRYGKDGKQTAAYSQLLATAAQQSQQIIQDKVDQANAIADARTDPRDTVGEARNKLGAAKGQLAVDLVGTTKWAADFKAVAAARLAVAQASVAVANAREEAGVRPGDTLGEARAKLDTAKRDLKLALKGTADYYTKLKAVQDAQVALADQKVASALLAAQAHTDPRDVLSLDREAVQAAKQKLATDRANKVGKDQINADLVALAQANQTLVNDQVSFSQSVVDAHTNYLDPLSVARANIQKARLALGADLAGTTKFNEDLAALHQAEAEFANSFQGQFNIGTITLPTPYQVRAAVQAGGFNQYAASQTNQVVYIDINGADTAQIANVLGGLLGSGSLNVGAVQPARKVA